MYFPMPGIIDHKYLSDTDDSERDNTQSVSTYAAGLIALISGGVIDTSTYGATTAGYP